MFVQAVVWREGDGPVHAGKVEADARRLTLEGSGPWGALARRRIPFEDVTGVRIGRSAEERMNGERTVIIDRSAGQPLQIAPLNGAGTLFELGNTLAERVSEAAAASRLVVVLPIRRGARARAARLVADGPPFDPEAELLDRHHVFVTDREVVFLFEGSDARKVVERLARDPAVWKAAAAWRACLSGPPRFGEEAYGWTGREGAENGRG